MTEEPTGCTKCSAKVLRNSLAAGLIASAAVFREVLIEYLKAFLNSVVEWALVNWFLVVGWLLTPFVLLGLYYLGCSLVDGLRRREQGRHFKAMASTIFSTAEFEAIIVESVNDMQEEYDDAMACGEYFLAARVTFRHRILITTAIAQQAAFRMVDFVRNAARKPQ